MSASSTSTVSISTTTFVYVFGLSHTNVEQKLKITDNADLVSLPSLYFYEYFNKTLYFLLDN